MNRKKRFIGAGISALLLLSAAQNGYAQWSLTGNAGTVSGTNFLGTTDNVDLRIRTNNTDRMFIGTNGFVGIGTTTAIGSSNFVISSSVNGWAGMYTNGTSSTTKPFYGYSVSGSTVAWHYYDPTTSTWILHVGASDRMFVTNSGNVGIGVTAPTNKLEVSGNGKFTGGLIVNGITTLNNTLYGNAAYMSYISSNGDITASGSLTGTDLIVNNKWTINNSGMSGTGTFTVNPDMTWEGAAIFHGSYFVAKKISSGTDNSQAGITGSAIANHPSLVSYGVLGDANGSPYAYGVACIGNGYYTGDWFEFSDRKFKTNTQPVNNALGLVMKLQPRTYEFRQNEFPQLNFPSGMHYGFIAQEVEQVAPDLVGTTTIPVDKNKPEGERTEAKMVNYIGLIPVLTEAIQEQQLLIQRQDSIISAQNARLDRLEGTSNASITANASGENRLYQNQPNPTGGETLIRYSVSTEASRVFVLFRDMNGNTVKTIPVEVKGEGAITFQAQELKAGLYTYELIVDGKVCDSKKMVITN